MSLRSMSLLLLVACAGTPAPPVPPQAPRAPVVLAIDVLDGAPLPGTRMALRARVEKQGVWDAPITVAVRVPPGARLVGGAAQSVLAGDGAQEIVLELSTVPVEDLVVTASSQREGAGFHAEARYRFGRPAPTKDAPPRADEHVTTPGGVDLGAPVKMK